MLPGHYTSQHIIYKCMLCPSSENPFAGLCREGGWGTGQISSFNHIYQWAISPPQMRRRKKRKEKELNKGRKHSHFHVLYSVANIKAWKWTKLNSFLFHSHNLIVSNVEHPLPSACAYLPIQNLLTFLCYHLLVFAWGRSF